MAKKKAIDEQPAPTGQLAWIGFGCCIFALACMAISFCSPYWLQTWPMSENQFRNIGLWEVCFYNYMHFKDDSQEIYSECWWVFNTEAKYYKLREWLLPPWFISCQVMVTGCLLILLATTVVTALIFLHVCPLMNHEYLQTYGMFASGSMMFLVTMVCLVVAILFGYQVNDRYWLPRPDQNYLSWGFGFLIITAIFSLVSGILLFKAAWDTYQELLRREDEYTRHALEMSAFQMEGFGPTEQDVAVVQPGFSGVHPFPEEAVAPADLIESRPTSYNEPPSYEQAQGYQQRREPWPERYEPEPVASAPLMAAEVRSPEPLLAPYDQRESGAFGKSFEQPSTYGKSYGKSYERPESDISYDEGEQEYYPPKPERQY